MKENLRKALIIPLCLIWLLLLGSFLFIFHQAHRAFLDRETDSARQLAGQYYRQILLAEAQTQEAVLAMLCADHQVQDALRAGDSRFLQQQSQDFLHTSGAATGTIHLHYYSPNLVPLAEQHHTKRTGSEYASQVLQQANRTRQSTYGLGLDPLSTLTFWTALPCRDHNHTLLGYVLAGKQIGFFQKSARQPFSAGGERKQLRGDFLLLLDKKYLNRDEWETGVRLSGNQPNWDQLPGTVLANHSFPANRLAEAIAAINAGTAVVKLDGRYCLTTSYGMEDIKGRPVGRILIFTDIDQNLRDIHRSYYGVIAIFLVLGLILFALTVLFLKRIQQRLDTFKEQLRIESMERESAQAMHHEELQKTWQYLQNIIECIGAPLMVVNQDFRILLTNRSLKELLPGPLPPNSFCHDVLAPDSTDSPTPSAGSGCARQCHFPACPVQEVFDTGRPTEKILPVFEKNGLPLISQILAWPVLNENSSTKQVVLVFHDITALKQSEKRLQWESTVNGGLAELAKAFSDPHITIDEITSLVMEKARMITGSKLSLAGYIDPETNHFICPAMSPGAMAECEVASGDVHFEIFRGLWGWVLEHRTPLLSNNAAEDQRATGLPEGHLPIKRFMAVPAMTHGELVGEVAVANSDQPYTEQDLLALEQYAVLYGIALQRQRWIKALADSRQEAVDANRSKDQFIANMSHELRTPLNGILGMNNLLLATELTSRQNKYLTMSKNSAEGLLRIINDLLDFSKAAANQLAIINTPFALAQLLNEIIELHTIDAKAKGIELILQLHDDVPRTLGGDAGRLRQILINLTSNAIKFTDHGSVVIEVQRQDGIQNGNRRDLSKTFLLFTVRDSGIGIAEENKPRLFKEFTQLDGSLTRKYGGTGLGLSFCKKLTELMQGRIWCESVAGEGSAFHCLLPFTTASGDLQGFAPPPPTPTVARETSEPAADSLMRPVHILLAEDDLINREVAMEYLRRRNWQVTAVTDGAAAVEAFREKSFDLILMDVQMPKMDGLEATHHIRKLEQLSGGHIPIIALTAHSLQGYRDQCRIAGMDAFLSKPLNPESLYGTIENSLRIRQTGSVMTEPSTTSSAASRSPDENAVIDLSLMRAALHDNWDLLRKLVHHFTEAAPQQLQALREAISQEDARQTREIAHALKGTLANFGARTASELAAEIETLARENKGLTGAQATGEELAISIDRVLLALAEVLRQETGSE
ncbi:MAG: ATP-binding protein [Desulfobulbaceae bacterium]|nr:ATP-binding protein [Desulfobulbaceae bacterium]